MLGLAASLAVAQPLPGSIEIGAGAGRFFGGTFAKGTNHLSDEKLGADDDILKGLWLSAQLTRQWGLEFAVRRTETHLVQTSSGVAPREPAVAVFIPATIELLGVRSFQRGSFVPYFGIGIGLMNVEFDTSDPAVRDVNRVCVSVAVGARYYMARWVGLRIDVRGRATYLGTRGRGEDRGWSDTGRWFRNAELLGGAFLSFGGK
jgi:outer membrane protein W